MPVASFFGATMARNLTTALKTEFLATGFTPIFLVEAEFSSGTIRVWTGPGDITWNSQTWTGVGDLGGISEIIEGTALRANNVVLQLSGIPQAMALKALDEVRYGKPATIWFGALDSNGAVVADPFLAFQGTIDSAELVEGAEFSTMKVNIENEAVSLQNPREQRHTDEEQQEEYPGDKGFEFVPKLQEKNVMWGGKSSAIPSSGGSSGGPKIHPADDSLED